MHVHRILAIAFHVSLVSGEITVITRAKKYAKVTHVTKTAVIATTVTMDTGETRANMSVMRGAMEHVTSQTVIALARMDIGKTGVKTNAMKAAMKRVTRQMVIALVSTDTGETDAKMNAMRAVMEHVTSQMVIAIVKMDTLVIRVLLIVH